MNTTLRPLIVGLGELIWDMLPDGKQLGGAPTNFAYISSMLGNEAVVASRVGDDELGREALAKLERLGISIRHIQIDPGFPTGTVGVQVDERGEASFQVRTDAAWDFLKLTDDWKALASAADAICFGTLGQRNALARETILDFLKLTRSDAVRVFDVNLRHSFFSSHMLSESLELATIVKLNYEELFTVGEMLGLEENAELALATRLIEAFDLKLIAITHGESGSLLVSNDEQVTHAGFRVDVKDTIGAGDAFTAALVHHYLRKASLKEMSEAANRMGAWLCTHSGATPDVNSGSKWRMRLLICG